MGHVLAMPRCLLISSVSFGPKCLQCWGLAIALASGDMVGFSCAFTRCSCGVRSKTIQNLPPLLASLMKSTEPWSDEYYSHDIEEAMRQAGFTQVVTQEADHRHRVVLGFKSP